MSSEKLLPIELRLDTFISECEDEIRFEIDELQRSQDGNLLSLDVEFHSYQTLQVFASIAYALKNNVIQQEDVRAYKSMYRAIIFAYQAAVLNYGDNMELDVAKYLVTVADQEDSYDRFTQDVQRYLGDNPAVSELLDYYIDEIDDHCDHHYAAELAGGMVFMLVERAQAELFIQEEAQNVSMSELDGLGYRNQGMEE